MFKLKPVVFYICFFITLSGYSQFTEEINTNRPGESQGAFAVGKNIIQLETGLYGIYEKHDVQATEVNGFGTNLDLRVGLFAEQLELNLSTQYQFDTYLTVLGIENRNAMKKSIVGAKFLLYDPHKNYKEKVNIISWYANQGFKWRQFIPAISFFGGINVNFDNPYTFKEDPRISPKLILITQNQFGHGVALVSNLIADRINSKYPSYGYIVTLSKSLGKRFSGFIENQGYKSDFYSDLIFRGGATYTIKNDMQVDISAGSNIKNTPYILSGGVGFSWRFDELHEPLNLKAQRKQRKLKNDMKKKKRNRDVNGNKIDPPKKMPKWKDIDREPKDPDDIEEVTEIEDVKNKQSFQVEPEKIVKPSDSTKVDLPVVPSDSKEQNVVPVDSSKGWSVPGEETGKEPVEDKKEPTWKKKSKKGSKKKK
jgi:hypothetical protein